MQSAKAELDIRRHKVRSNKDRSATMEEIEAAWSDLRKLTDGGIVGGG